MLVAPGTPKARTAFLVGVTVLLLVGQPKARAFNSDEPICGAPWLGLCMFLAAPLNLIPAELGPEFSLGSRETKWVVGWPVQIPIGPWQHKLAHRLVITPEVTLPHADFRMRLGYRHVFGRWAAGLGTVLDGRDFALSPELGSSFGMLNLILRADILHTGCEPARASLLFGWSFY